MKAELIGIGDEILIGHTLDTNSNWIAGRLSENGLRLRWISVVGDNSSDLKHQEYELKLKFDVAADIVDKIKDLTD